MNILEAYVADLPTKHVPKGQMIFMQGDRPEHAFGIKNGIMKMYNLTADGEPNSISYGMTGELFPVCWTFSATEKTLYYYQAYTDCDLYVIDKQALTDELQHNAQLAYALLEIQTKVYVYQTLRINALEQSRASMKLACMLHLLCLRYGRTLVRDRVEIQIPLTQQELSESLGLTRETTATELKALQDKGVINRNAKLYTVNTAKLNQELDDEYDPGIHISRKTD